MVKKKTVERVERKGREKKVGGARKEERVEGKEMERKKDGKEKGYPVHRSRDAK